MYYYAYFLIFSVLLNDNNFYSQKNTSQYLISILTKCVNKFLLTEITDEENRQKITPFDARFLTFDGSKFFHTGGSVSDIKLSLAGDSMMSGFVFTFIFRL